MNKGSVNNSNKKTVHQKIQPVVVKHVIKTDRQQQQAVPTLHDLKMTHQQSFTQMGKESVRFSETSMSPRFYGQGQPPYYGRPEEVSRDLLSNL